MKLTHRQTAPIFRIFFEILHKFQCLLRVCKIYEKLSKIPSILLKKDIYSIKCLLFCLEEGGKCPFSIAKDRRDLIRLLSLHSFRLF